MTRVRFAAALGGNLLVSGARVALANDLFARRRRARMVLRLDDLDDARAGGPPIDQVVRDLRWLGVGWDRVVRQSERSALYQDAIERLQRDGLIYPCFESEAELRAKLDYARRRGQPTVYDRAMLKLTSAQRRDAEAGGKRPHWRFKLSGRMVDWHDLILGRRQAALSTVSDPIVVRADGAPTSVLAGAVDDVEDGTTHIIRGEDSAGGTAVMIELLGALGGSDRAVRFGHVPALAASRMANPTIRGLRHDGVEPSAVVASLLGGSRPLPLEEVAGQFELAELAKVGFDTGRMLALNRMVLATSGFAAVVDRLPAGATEAFWLAVRGSLDLLSEARHWWDVVAGTIVPPVMADGLDGLRAARAVLPPEPWDDRVWADWMGALGQNADEALMTSMRLALTGEDGGPELGGLLPLMGRRRAAERLEIAISGSSITKP